MSRFKTRWNNMPKPVRITFYVILGILGVAAMGIVFGYAIQLLWNWLMPELFGLGKITYWQAIGIFALAKLIFGFGFGGSGDSSKCDSRESEKGANWKDYDAWWEKEGKAAFDKYSGDRNGQDGGGV